LPDVEQFTNLPHIHHNSVKTEKYTTDKQKEQQSGHRAQDFRKRDTEEGPDRYEELQR
jgi:hypothetical protein